MEEKWQVNKAKVAYARKFPGMLTIWEDTVGKTIQTVVPIRGQKEWALLIFTEGSFTFASGSVPEPSDLLEGIRMARPYLEKYHADAYAELDRLIEQDKELTRLARMERIIGAVQNNLAEIPELRDKLLEFLKEKA